MISYGPSLVLEASAITCAPLYSQRKDGWGCKRASGGRRLRGHLADGSVGLGEDDGRADAGVGTGMGVCGRRRLSSRSERGENAEWHSADRCRPRSVAGDSAGADCGLDRGEKKCGPGLFGFEAGV